eukprot:CCRYP_006292-RA/>CCRYP_006292-RA protein AED:0.00 eAED:0.00 QI:11/1/1/1/0/0/2/105/74
MLSSDNSESDRDGSRLVPESMDESFTSRTSAVLSTTTNTPPTATDRLVDRVSQQAIPVRYGTIPNAQNENSFAF